MDSGQNVLRPMLQKFLKYKFTITVDKSGRFRWLQAMSNFGAMPKLPNFWRLTHFRNLNRMRIYQAWPLAIAGPTDFSQLMFGQEEYDEEFLLLPFHNVHPAQGEHPYKDYCIRGAEDIGDLKYEFEDEGCYLLSNCAELYP
jgi:hypothetical protein